MRRFLPITTLALTGLVVTGCATNATAPAAVESDSDASIDVQFTIEPTNLDITSTSGAALQQLLISNVYEGLISKDADGNYIPALATEWTVSDDALTYTFELGDATFHDGSPVDVDDVVASLDAARGAESVNPDAKRMTLIDTVTAVDDEIEITLSARDTYLLDTLSITSAGMIVPADDETDRANATNGSGPYTVAQWNKGSTITLERNDDYWGEAPKNKSVTFHYMTEATTAMNALSSGEVDVLTSATAETVDFFAGDDAVQVTAGDSTSWMTLGMNNAHPVLANADVRRAINMGIDKAGLINVIGGHAVEVGSMAVPSDPWYSDLTDINAYDPEGARELLDDIDPSDLALTLTVANTYDTKISEYIAAQLSEIGINVTIDTVEFPTWLEQAYKQKQYDLTMVLHVDPTTLTYYGNPDYYWNYDNAEAQELASAAKSAATLEERDEKMAELAELVADDAASGWLYSPQTMVVAATDVAGYPVDRIANRFPVSGITAAD
jgi:peptide/nickel transport system substrate-binding protein